MAKQKKRKEHTMFYFTKEVDDMLRKLDEARAKVLTDIWKRRKK